MTSNSIVFLATLILGLLIGLLIGLICLVDPPYVGIALLAVYLYFLITWKVVLKVTPGTMSVFSIFGIKKIPNNGRIHITIKGAKTLIFMYFDKGKLKTAYFPYGLSTFLPERLNTIKENYTIHKKSLRRIGISYVNNEFKY